MKAEAQLVEASKHLVYEHKMLKFAGAAILSGIASGSPLNNALIESFALHLRALIGFFYDTRTKPQIEGQGKAQHDDILAEDFFPSRSQWEDLRGALEPALIRARTRGHKELAHLTYKRLGKTEQEKSWPVAELTKLIDRLMEVFTRDVPRDCLSKAWKVTEQGPSGDAVKAAGSR